MIGIGITGLASGLDTESIIASLIAVERQPRVRMQQREDAVEARQNALRDINSRLKNLKTAAADLRSVSLWADTQSVETNDATKMTARRVSGAGPGGYQVAVTQLARAEQRTFTYTASASATTITLDGDSDDPVVIDIGANATLDDVVATINSNAEAPVYAVNVDGALVLSSRKTGSAYGFSAAGATIAEDPLRAKDGLDAKFTVDGGAEQTSSSNVVTTAIPGVELTFKAVTGGTPMTVTVSEPAPDKAKVKEKLEAFVEQYNSTIELIRSKLTEERDESDPTKGVLRNDSMLNGLLTTLRQSLSETFAGNPADVDELAEIGISTGAATGEESTADALAGKLVLDSSKLDAKLESNLLDVRRMLGGVSGVDGFAQRFEGILDPVTQVDGTLDERIGAADSELDEIRDQMDRLDERLELREERLRTQFATLERLLSQSQSQSQWLAGQLGALVG